jgi:hypothetical protein
MVGWRRKLGPAARAADNEQGEQVQEVAEAGIEGVAKAVEIADGFHAAAVSSDKLPEHPQTLVPAEWHGSPETSGNDIAEGPDVLRAS